MTATEDARRVFDSCGDQRVLAARFAAINPDIARDQRQAALDAGCVPVADDPFMQVRCSVLERMCRDLLGIEEPAPTVDPDQLDLFDVPAAEVSP